jgi:hypothetical protein
MGHDATALFGAVLDAVFGELSLHATATPISMTIPSRNEGQRLMTNPLLQHATKRSTSELTAAVSAAA